MTDSDCLKLSQLLTSNSNISCTSCYPALERSINYSLQQSQSIDIIFVFVINAERKSQDLTEFELAICFVL